jgi:structural maintenance of chromosome 2
MVSSRMNLHLVLFSSSRYSVRTVLGPFDRQFNAITGLNGSGKSNVLDGICFVLGITNLSKVRASNLSELVYKQGQAGITKASVTVVFNNSDKSRSPVGFESCDQIAVCRQIVIGGRNRYFLNGKTAQLQEIYNLFHSVQLNINNPHFLIMQGSITKVINMKPQEILGMIEEAAGTSMYESKKHLALRTLERKQLKVEEIDRIIKEEIEPQLTKLKEEKRAFVEWSELIKEAEELERIVVGWEYRSVVGKLAGGGGQYDETEKELKRWVDELKQLQVSVTKAEERTKNDIKSLEKQKASQAEIEANLQKEISALQNKLAELKSILKEKSSSLKSTSGRQLKSKSQEVKLESNIEKKKAEIVEAAKQGDELREKTRACDALIESLQAQQADLNAGGQGTGSLQQESIAQRSKLESITTEIKSTNITLKGHETRLKQLKAAKNNSSSSDEYERMSKERSSLLEKKTELEKRMQELPFDQSRFSVIGEQIRTNERKIESLTESAQQLRAGVAQRLTIDLGGLVDDPQRVKGLVAQLLTFKPEFGDKYLRAVEVLCGPKLFNVVVDSERTCKEILQSGKLKKRLTLLPLDRIQGKKVSREQLDQASLIARRMNGEAIPAIETVAYQEELGAAIEYVLGSHFVCDKKDIADKVTNNSALPMNMRHKTATPDGDVYDPKGFLVGGEDANSARSTRLMQSIYELNRIAHELEDLRQETAKLAGEKQRMMTFKDAFEKLSKELHAVAHSVNMIDSKLKSTSQSLHAEEMEAAEAGIREATVRLGQLENEKKTIEIDIQRIEKEIAEFMKNKTEKVKAVASQLAAAKKEKKQITEETKAAGTGVAKHELDLKTLEEELVSFREELSNQTVASSALEAEIGTLETKIQSVKDQLETLEGKRKEIEIHKKSFEKSIADISQALSAEKARLDEAEVNAKKFESLMEQLAKERKEAKTEVERLEKEFSWLRQARDKIVADESLARKSKPEIEKLKSKLSDLKVDVSIKGKSINRRIIPLIERSEKEATDLLTKREALEKEKRAIHEFISELDEKKGRALSKTWQIVNANFGAIFRSLLPNVDAKLAPPEGMTALEGLELRVQLGSAWKDSLTELSGGQKSLLALSLVLALLLFKPAPFYILDEVDAALDVSHTRNIGRMIKQHFPHSQFIIVSLKDGMFNNANVLFRVRFENGTSVVSRNEQSNAIEDVEDSQPKAISGSAVPVKSSKKQVIAESNENADFEVKENSKTRRKARN